MNKDLLATHQIVSLLERSKTVTDRILDQLPGLFLATDARGLILRANISVSALLDVPHEDIAGKHVSELFKPATWQKFQEPLQSVIEGTHPSMEFELVIDRAENVRSYFWQIHAMMIRASDGSEIKLYAIHGRDITDLKVALSSVAVLGKNMELAKAVQNLILPRSSTHISPGFKFAAHYEPAEVTGGDYWWFDFKNGKPFLLVGDVTGHGAGSAMVTSLISGTINTLKRVKPNYEIREIFELVNANLLGLEGQPYWMTLFSLEVDVENRQLDWIGAAAPPVFHMRKDGKIDVYLEMSSHLGTPNLKLAHGSAKFEPGERVLVFTDGVFEMQGPEDRTLGLRGTQKALLRTLGQPIEEARVMIDNHLKNWRGKIPLADDAAFFVVDF